MDKENREKKLRESEFKNLKEIKSKNLNEIELKQNKYAEKISAVPAEQLAKALETLMAKDKDKSKR